MGQTLNFVSGLTIISDKVLPSHAGRHGRRVLLSRLLLLRHRLVFPEPLSEIVIYIGNIFGYDLKITE